MPLIDLDFESGLATPFVIADGTPSISTAAALTGSYGMECDAQGDSAGYKYDHTASNVVVVRLRWRLRSNIDPTQYFWQVRSGASNNRVGFRSNSSHQLRVKLGTTETTITALGTLALNTTYKLEFRLDMSANPWTFDWRHNDVAQTQLTEAATAATADNLRLGWGGAAPNGPIADFDDVALSLTGGDYPIGPTDAAGVPGVWIDWDADGFAGADDITADVTAMSWSRGASFDHVSAAGPGNATIKVQNSDGKYNPDNTGSSLYGKLLPNRPVWAGAVRDTGALSGAGDVRGVFGGHITEIVPTPVPGGNPTAEILCEDVLGAARRATATVSPQRDITRGDFRSAVLTAMGVPGNRRSLEPEADPLPFAAADTRESLGLLEELNRSDSARHFVAPADTKEGWYAYTLVNRLHKLSDAADEAVNADDVTDLSGYRVTLDNIVNLQRATVSPIDFGAVNEVVWTAAGLPITITVGQPITLWPEFADYVFGAAVSTNSTGGSLVSTLTNFGTSAKLVLTASGSAVTITSLTVTGSSLRRGDLETVRSEASASSTAYGPRAGGDVSSDYIGQPGAAKAVTDYLVWKFDQPLKRPTITVAGKSTATYRTIFDRDLFDVVTLTVDRLHMVARRFEIIGLRGTVVPGTFWEVSYELQETPDQAAATWWVWDTSSWDAGTLWAPF